MLTLWSDRVECLWEESLPVEVKQLPDDLAALDRVVRPAAAGGDRGAVPAGVPGDGPVRVDRWAPDDRDGDVHPLDGAQAALPVGYRSLVAEVSDSIHLRRFCRISLSERVPDESTVRKLTRRLGAETVSGLTRALIVAATREKRFRPRAVRIDSTVVDADIKYPTDSGLASDGVRALAREGRKLAERIGETRRRVRDRSRAVGRRLRGITRTIRRRSGEAKAEVLKLTAQTGELLERSVKEARRLAKVACSKARGRGAKAKLKAAGKLEELADHCEKVAQQIRQRVKGEPISDRIVSLSDPDARPIRKGKLGKPNEFGYVTQLAEVTENTKRGARGLILPASTAPGNPAENALLPATVEELKRLGISPREVALDGGFMPAPTNQALAELAPDRMFISGRQEPGSRRTNRRLQRYRTGEEGRISHLKRRYGMGRSRLKGDQGQQIWTEWGILAYNTDTLAIRTP